MTKIEYDSLLDLTRHLATVSNNSKRNEIAHRYAICNQYSILEDNFERGVAYFQV